MERSLYDAYLSILREELIPAMGCTEPTAIAYAGALLRRTLGAMPEEAKLTVSGNIIKNVKSVIVPHTGGRKGLAVALAAGMLYGDPERELEALEGAGSEDAEALEPFLARVPVTVLPSSSGLVLDILAEARGGGQTARVRIADTHTGVVLLQRGDTVLLDKPFPAAETVKDRDREILTVENIVAFAEEAELSDVRPLLERQIEYNMAIAREGIGHPYGAQIGRVLLRAYGDTPHNKAKAWAAAASDARMNGCEMPVIINSGSGNQGIAASVPVIVYAREMSIPEEKLLRALIVSNLITVRLKSGIGRLSAYCGAVSAGAGAGAGVCRLMGGGYREIAHTVVNALAINSGMICDGAKSSCAAKIASAVEAGLLGMQMYFNNSQFYGGDGIVVKGVENTIDAVSTLAREGMRETDREIISLMMEEREGRSLCTGQSLIAK